MLAPMDGGAASKAVAADLKLGVDVLKPFQDRVNRILKDLESSPGSADKIDHMRFTQTSLTTDGRFHEAVSLHGQYQSIHGRITALSKTLAMQIEAMGIAARGAEIGFDNLEEEERRRFWAIQTHTERQEQVAEERNHPNKPKERGNDKHTGMGLT